ncbi:RNA polymerase sigma factor [Nocardia tengchongensis]|uniref:RNA polymerase sigma factor n=1 Tax=Nocardia tengchongensis TaxID=2055889 RepID=UPI0036CAD739
MSAEIARRSPIEVNTEVLTRAQRGDALALHELLRVVEPYVGRICGAIALDEGPDAAQETLIIVFKNVRSVREPQALAGWVRTIATREAIRIARRRPLTTDPLDLADVPDLSDPETRIDVRRTLERLSPEHRAVLILSAFDDLDETAIAAQLSVSRGTVKSRLHRARTRFRNEWRA